jgi:DNA polymerase-3 subunit delta'
LEVGFYLKIRAIRIIRNYIKMDFIGNHKTIASLQKSLERGMLNHAYIFSGPAHVGKFTLAKMFALSAIGGKELGLETDNFDKDALLDLIVVEPETVEKNGVSKQRDISIESIRDAKQSLSLFPYHGKYKILIVDGAHKLNVAAQNALLKILEEPNRTTMIILVTHEADRILPTVQSRCQTVNFALAGDGEMQTFFSPDIVSLSTGRPGLAHILSQDEGERVFRSEAALQLDKVMGGSLSDRFALAEEFSKDTPATLEKLNVWIWEMRKKALTLDDVRRQNSYAQMEKIQKSMETLKRTNASSRLVLETLFMDLK